MNKNVILDKIHKIRSDINNLEGLFLTIPDNEITLEKYIHIEVWAKSDGDQVSYRDYIEHLKLLDLIYDREVLYKYFVSKTNYIQLPNNFCMNPDNMEFEIKIKV